MGINVMVISLKTFGDKEYHLRFSGFVYFILKKLYLEEITKLRLFQFPVEVKKFR